MFSMIPFKKNSLLIGDDPFGPFLREFFDDNFGHASLKPNLEIRTDIKETKDEFIIESEIPGVNKENVDIGFKDKYLTISVKSSKCLNEEKESFVKRERFYGNYKRSFYFDNVDEDNINASLENGILKVNIPKKIKEDKQYKKIDIK